MENTENENSVKKLTIKEKIHQYFKPEGTQVEMLRYRTNSISSSLTLLALCCIVASFSTVYGYCYKATAPGVEIGFDIFASIIMILISFLAMQEVKNYSKVWGYIEFGIAALAIGKIFIYPYSAFTNFESEGVRTLDGVRFSVVVILNSIAAFFYVIAGVLSIVRGNILRKFLSENNAIENEIIKGK